MLGSCEESPPHRPTLQISPILHFFDEFYTDETLSFPHPPSYLRIWLSWKYVIWIISWDCAQACPRMGRSYSSSVQIWMTFERSIICYRACFWSIATSILGLYKLSIRVSRFVFDASKLDINWILFTIDEFCSIALQCVAERLTVILQRALPCCVAAGAVRVTMYIVFSTKALLSN